MASEPQHQTFSWKQVQQEAIAGLIVVSAATAIGGIGYIAYTVPGKLDHVLNNQAEFRGRIGKLETKADDQEVRIIKLEMRK